MIKIFNLFRKEVKALLKEKHITYSQIASASDISEATIKCFMCGASDSRRIAEKITSFLGGKLVYANNEYTITMNT